MSEGRVTLALAHAVVAAVLGMFQFGVNTGVINAPQEFIVQFIEESYQTSRPNAETLFAVAVSLFAVGGMIGCPLGSWLSEKRGRRGALLLNSLVGIIGALLLGFCHLADSYEMLAIGRLLIGVNCGLATTVAPTYVSEVAPVRLRGGFGTVNQLAVTFGLVISQVLGIDSVLGTADRWSILLGLAVIPSAVQLLALITCPESPRYLLIAQRDEESARTALVRLRGTDDVEAEIAEMHAEDRSQRTDESVSLLSLFTVRALRLPLIVGIVMHLSQQFSGINAVLYYSTAIFQRAGLEVEAARLATVGVGGVMVLMTLVSVPLMDRAGRRTLHLVGLAGMFVFSILITVALFTYENNSTMSAFAVVFTLAYVAAFGLGPGSIPWMIMSELFSQSARSKAVGVGSLVNWLANFIIGLVFPLMISETSGMGNYTFVPFTVLLAIFFVFTYFKLPETKNKTIEEITALYKT